MLQVHWWQSGGTGGAGGREEEGKGFVMQLQAVAHLWTGLH